jgi:hypothetical protein
MNGNNAQDNEGLRRYFAPDLHSRMSEQRGAVSLKNRYAIYDVRHVASSYFVNFSDVNR